MPALTATELLRPGLLRGVALLLAGARGESARTHPIAGACRALGAEVHEHELLGSGAQAELDALLEEAPAHRALMQALEGLGALDVLVLDGWGLYDRCSGEQPRRGLIASMEASWAAVRAIASAAFLARERPGRIVLLAPPPGAGPHAGAATSGLENLARTLSIEWARFAVTPVAIAPGDATGAGELAALVAYLASPAASYFSGCLLDLRGPAAARA